MVMAEATRNGALHILSALLKGLLAAVMAEEKHMADCLLLTVR